MSVINVRTLIGRNLGAINKHRETSTRLTFETEDLGDKLKVKLMRGGNLLTAGFVTKGSTFYTGPEDMKKQLLIQYCVQHSIPTIGI